MDGADSDAACSLCALVPPVDAENIRRSLDRAGLLDTQARAFRHADSIALPLSGTASGKVTPISAAEDNGSGLLDWASSAEPLRTKWLKPPQRRGANPLRAAVERALSSSISSGVADHSHLAVLLAEDALPKRWEKLGDCVLFAPRGMFDRATPAADTLDRIAPSARRAVMAALAEALGACRLGVQGVIEESLHRKSTVRLIWPEGCSDGWVVQRENGILYGLDVTRNMFSSGNGTEKARVSRFDCSGQVVVDLYAGIGYFTLPYLVHAKAAHLHACEWDEDALAALAHNLAANGVADRCTLHPGDNAYAASSIGATMIGAKSGSGAGNEATVETKAVADAARVAHHVNLGLIPTSEAAWGVALSVLRPEGGMLHVHANVGSTQQEEKEFCAHLAARLSELAISQSVGRTLNCSHVTICHVERVKSYAPKINHVVVDVRIGRIEEVS